MTDKKAREFWIRWQDHWPNNLKHVITNVMTTKFAEEDIHVIDKSAYDKAVGALKKIAEDFGTDYCDGNCLLAHQTLEELGEEI